MTNGMFRRKSGFTVVQNGITDDLTVSMKAKGLYLIIQSRITQPNRNWLKQDFKNLICEGEKAFDAAWQELKEKGYLKTHIIREIGKYCYTYELLDTADLGAHTFYYDDNGDVIGTNLTKNKKSANNSPYLPFGGVEKAGVEKAGPVKEGDITNIISRNSNLNTLSINPAEENQNEDKMDKIDYRECEASIKANIDYEQMREDMDDTMLSRVDEIVNVIVDVVTSAQEEIRVGKVNRPYDQVKETLLKIKSEHVRAVISGIDRCTKEISNPRAYLISALYNSVSTLSMQPVNSSSQKKKRNSWDFAEKRDYDVDAIEKQLLAL